MLFYSVKYCRRVNIPDKDVTYTEHVNPRTGRKVTIAKAHYQNTVLCKIVKNYQHSGNSWVQPIQTKL